MRPSSAKAKGRKLQQWVVEKLVALLGFDTEDLETRTMGSSGEDVIMGVQSRKQFPYSIECKNQQAVNVWKAYEQSCANCKDYEPLVIIKRNNTKPLALVDAEYFIKLHNREQNVNE